MLILRSYITWLLTYIVYNLVNHVVMTNFAFVQPDFPQFYQ